MAKREEKVTESTTKKPIQDLREWLQRVEELGDLVHVKEAVSCDEEMSAIGYLVAKQKPSPAILFETSRATRKARSRRARCGTFSGRAFRASP